MSNLNKFSWLRVRAATSCSSAAIGLALLATPAFAQADQAQPAPAPQQTSPADADASSQDIVVTGIRASLQSAAALKRDSAIVLDAITSEDLGKFPDANVAESLQRIPGVSIDRSNGEGKFVTVRGLGPQFNTVLFNGRSLASDNYGREFSFDLLAAELISGADVYKTSQARLQDGGIGATVNLHTARPLDLKGFRVVATAKGNYEQNNKKVTPQLFGLVSDTFADGTIGLLGSISYQKRIAQVNSVTTDGYLPGQDIGPQGNFLARNVYAPRNVTVTSAHDERSRLGATLVGQFRPNDQLLITVDGLYNKFKSDSTNKALGLWFEPSQYTAATVDKNNTVTALTTKGNADMIDASGVRDTETYEFGVNVDWHPTDTLRVTFDATRSRAKNSGAGKSFFTVAGIPTTYSFTSGGPGELPTVTTGAPLTDPTVARTHLAQRAGNDVTENVREARLDTEWKAEAGALDAIRFGGAYTSRRRVNQSAGTLNVNCFYCGYPTLADPSLFSTFTIGKIGSGGSVPTSFLQYDPNAYLAYLSSPASLAARDQAFGLAPGTSARDLATQSEGNGYNAVYNPADYVQERVYAGYVETDFKGTLGGVPWLVNLGARYVHTELVTHSQTRALVDILTVPNDPTIYNAVYQNGNTFTPVDAKNTYDVFLPDANVTIKVQPNVNLRLGASQTLTRPSLSDLRPVTTFDVLRPATLQASGGNPDLKPYKSTNFDISAEWYPTPTTTLSIAGFYKNVKDFIVTTFANEVFQITNSQNIAVQGKISGQNATFSVARPRNAGSANIRGVELNAVHTFDWLPGFFSGFGTQLNATFVSTNRGFDINNPGQRFAVVGLSNSQNATLFYEKYGISTRIAYNHRDKFLSSLSDGSGGEPLFVRGFGQFDASASYDVTPNAQVFFEGTNIFNAKYVTSARFDNQLRAYQNYGARFDAGVRLKF